MERLTERKVGQSYPLKDKAASKVGLFTDYDGFYTYFEAVNRLGAIEDILGDDYDLDRLRELAELTKNIPHVCRFCVGCEMEPKDGHGCDEYDSFVFSTRRLRELMEADREGRCVVLPPDDYTWTIRGDIIRGIIHANCRAAKKEAEAALRREQDGE